MINVIYIAAGAFLILMLVLILIILRKEKAEAVVFVKRAMYVAISCQLCDLYML